PFKRRVEGSNPSSPTLRGRRATTRLAQLTLSARGKGTCPGFRAVPAVDAGRSRVVSSWQEPVLGIPSGNVAKWQGKGLQNPDHRFESGRRLPAMNPPEKLRLLTEKADFVLPARRQSSPVPGCDSDPYESVSQPSFTSSFR